jgi:tRNA(Ile)-lysidine synthase TilS/MesJ
MDKRINDILSKLNKYVNKEETLVVGVSTGMDSMALFFVLVNNDYKVVVAHINHKRRVV